MELPLTGTPEHKALVMVIERLATLETAMDSLTAAVSKMADPLLHVNSHNVHLLQVNDLYKKHASEGVDRQFEVISWDPPWVSMKCTRTQAAFSRIPSCARKTTVQATEEWPSLIR
eukprot:jgi/Astpho2/5738/fgenesh1_pg.00080_%23_12_t